MSDIKMMNFFEASKKEEPKQIVTREIGLSKDEALNVYNLYRYYKKIVALGEIYTNLTAELEEKGVFYKIIKAIVNKLGNIRNKQVEILSKRNRELVKLVYRGEVTKTTFNTDAWLDKCGEIYGIEKDIVEKMKEYYKVVTDPKNKEDYKAFRQQGDTSDPYFNMNVGSLKIPKINTSIKLDKDKMNSLFNNLNEDVVREVYSLYKEIMILLDKYEQSLDQLNAIITPVLSGEYQMAAESLQEVIKKYKK